MDGGGAGGVGTTAVPMRLLCRAIVVVVGGSVGSMVVFVVVVAGVQFGFQRAIVVVVMDVVVVVVGGGVVFSMDDGADKDLSLLLAVEVSSRGIFGIAVIAGMYASSRGRWNRGLSLVKLWLLPLFVGLLLLLVRLAAPIPRMRLACSTCSGPMSGMGGNWAKSCSVTVAGVVEFFFFF